MFGYSFEQEFVLSASIFDSSQIKEEYIPALRHGNCYLCIPGTNRVAIGSSGKIHLWSADNKCASITIQAGTSSMCVIQDNLLAFIEDKSKHVEVWTVDKEESKLVLQSKRDDRQLSFICAYGSSHLLCASSNGGIQIMKLEKEAILLQGEFPCKNVDVIGLACWKSECVGIVRSSNSVALWVYVRERH